MRIAVSGVGGLIGGALVKRLLEAGHQIVRLCRPSRQPTAGYQESEQIEVAIWEPTKGLVQPEQFCGVQAVVHLAGYSVGDRRWNSATKRKIYESRVTCTHRLMKQLADLATPPECVISASAIGVYGNCGDLEVDELAPLGSDFLAQVAADWEAACDPARQRGIRTLHPRLGIVLSQGGGALAKMLPAFGWGLGGALGNGKQYWSWISLEDCVQGLIWALSHPSARGTYNFVSPCPVQNRQFTRHLAHALGRKAFLPIPSVLLRILLGGMADSLLLQSCRAVPRRLMEEGFEFRFPHLAGFLEHELTSR